ncbi:MAG: hypothetical protein JSV84_07305 [Gemmatimonadota bacterium]|nr:MAG: hypothetical protein JSV84_07305 [Gemmatimonadota bacterium]
MYKKFALIGLVVALVAGIALAKAVKKDLVPFAAGCPEEGAYGKVMLNYAKDADKTEIQINCWGLTAGTEYEVWIDDGAGYVSYGTFTVRQNGTANFHAKPAGDISDALSVAVNDAANNCTVLISE